MNDWCQFFVIMITIISTTIWIHCLIVRERDLRNVIERKIDERIKQELKKYDERDR